MERLKYCIVILYIHMYGWILFAGGWQSFFYRKIPVGYLNTKKKKVFRKKNQKERRTLFISGLGLFSDWKHVLNISHKININMRCWRDMAGLVYSKADIPKIFVYLIRQYIKLNNEKSGIAQAMIALIKIV